MATPFIGEIIYFGGNFAPRNYAQCAGQLLSVAQNQALFAILGTTYGGNGTQTFALPDLRGRVPVGLGQSAGGSNYALGQQAGTESVALSLSNLPAHSHPATFTNNGSSFSAAPVKASVQAPQAGAVLGRTTDANGLDTPQIYAPSGTAATVALGGLNVAGTVAVGVAGSGQPVSNLQPFLVIFPLIALQGIYPSRN